MVQAFRDTAHLFAGEVAKYATAAFLCGRWNGRAEAGLESAAPDDVGAVAQELVAAGGYDEQKAEIRNAAEEVVQKLADTLYTAVGESDAVVLLSQWEGFGRFCRETLGIEPVSALTAFGTQTPDPPAELLAAFPDAVADEAEATRSAAEWSRSWGRRFGLPDDA
jgi:hypothetical protein